MKNILIVDDQADVPTLLKLVLEEGGRHFMTAKNGMEAVDIARQSVPDLILLDVMMPGEINGYEAAKILKKDPTTENCPIIIMTAKVQQEDREEAFASGADDFIAKPFNFDEVKEKVSQFLQ